VTITLVTGGAGFVGKHLVRKLKERGERVRVFDLAATGEPDDIQGSVTDEQAVADAMTGIESVFHLAGNAQLWSRRAQSFDEVNHKGTEIVAAAALRANVKRFVHCSSLTTLVGEKTLIGLSEVDEQSRLPPGEMLGAYPHSKLLAERAVERAAAEGLNAVIAIPTEPLGPGDDNLTPPTRMIVNFANGATPAYIDCMLNFVPVDSLAEGLIAVRKQGARGGRYLLGGENVPMRQFLARLQEITGHSRQKRKIPYWAALAAGFMDTKLIARMTGKAPKAPLTGVRLAGRQVSFSSEKAKRELGWQAAPFEDALRDTVQWLDAEKIIRLRR